MSNKITKFLLFVTFPLWILPVLLIVGISKLWDLFSELYDETLEEIEQERKKHE